MRTSNADRPRPVVVGVDGSAAARGAVEWAAEHAARIGAPLRLVHAVPAGTGAPAWPAGLLEVARVRGGRRSRYEAVTGRPADVLVARSEAARLLVVGSHRTGRPAGRRLLALAERAGCPVAVVRGPADHGPPGGGAIVAGVDGSTAGDAALAVAGDVAASVGARLVAVHTSPGRCTARDRRSSGRALPSHRAAVLLDAHLRRMLYLHPDLPVERHVVGVHPVRALPDTATRHRLLVVGDHAVPPGDRSLLGSTCRLLVEFAPCPILVVRADPTASG